jgi:hypothetical protein
MSVKAGQAQGRLQAGRLYLIRPDGYIAASLPIDSGHVSDADLRAALQAHQIRQNDGAV